ncbi:MAG: hypothetical protein JWP36_1834 [Paucimonas sp.]|nr:hypothetical protein [Paucimonas sp.]
MAAASGSRDSGEGRRGLSSLLVFPLAALLNSFSMTGLLLVFGLAGETEIAADIGLVQAATLALFYAFSANARNLVLGDETGRAGAQLLHVRLILMLPVAGAAWILSARLGGAGGLLAILLILRRLAEWASEIGLAVQERNGQPRIARQYLVAEAVALLLACLPPLLIDVPLPICLLPWALVPLIAARGAKLGKISYADLDPQALLPHFGSTAAIGTSTYVFRISIALLAGKAMAGELFTAFAIGGLLPTVFGQALVPSLAQRYRDRPWPRKLLLLPLAVIGAAAAFAFAFDVKPSLFALTRHAPTFWLATTLSIAGGALMSIALVLRARLIQRMEGGQVYGPDLLANVLIATCVPFVFYLLGRNALGSLYLLSAGLNLVFFLGSGRGVAARRQGQVPVLAVIAALLVLPVFVQMQGGLFQDPAMVFDAAGDIRRLPLPLSIAAAFAGIAALGNYSAAIRTLTTLFFTATLFVMSSLLVAAGDQVLQSAKLILLAQFLLPIFGLVLGEMFGAASPTPVFERTVLVVLLLVLPAQLIAGWMHGHLVAQPQVFFFSIYQHLQYLPSVVAATGTMTAMALWDAGPGWRRAVFLLWPVVMVHLVASMSFGAMAGGLAGLLCFAAWHGRRGRNLSQVAAVVLLALACATAYAALSQCGVLTSPLPDCTKSSVVEVRSTDKIATDGAHPELVATAPVKPRQYYWSAYARGATASVHEFLFGHKVQPDRRQFPSAYNYWLDALYNFGMLAILPLLLLVGATLRMGLQRRRAVLADPVLLGSALACMYLLLLENMVQVGMRQPYPGLITLFLWGMFISRLRRHKVDKDQRPAEPATGTALAHWRTWRTLRAGASTNIRATRESRKPASSATLVRTTRTIGSPVSKGNPLCYSPGRSVQARR